DRTQPVVGEDEAPVNAPKWTTAGYNGSLKASVEKYTCQNVASSPEPLSQTAPSTAPVKAGPSTAPVKAAPSRTDDIYFTLMKVLLLMRTFSIVIVVAKRWIRKRRNVAVVKTKVIVAVVKRVAVETKRMMIKPKERIRRKAAVQVVLVVKRKQMIVIKEKM